MQMPILINHPKKLGWFFSYILFYKISYKSMLLFQTETHISFIEKQIYEINMVYFNVD